MRKRRVESKDSKDDSLVPLEIPEEFLNGNDDNFRFNSNPDWIPLKEILPAPDPFSADVDFHNSLQELIKATTSNEIQEQEVVKKVIETVIAGSYDTEPKYVWLISAVSRIFLQKQRTSNSRILQSDVFKRFNCESLYSPAKMHHIAKDVYEVTRGNTFNIALLVSKLHHINPVLHYICICLVSAQMNQLHSKTPPSIFQPLKPTILVDILNELNLSSGTIGEIPFHEFLKLISLYNSLVVINKTLSEIHPPELVDALTESRDWYMDAVKRWLIEASNYVSKLMTKKRMCLWLVDLKQEILMVLQYGLRDCTDEVSLFRDSSYVDDC